MLRRVLPQARSIHWSPYDRVGVVVPAAVSSAPATAGGGVLRATELTDLERMLEEKIAKAKDSLGFDDDELAKLLSKLEFVEAPPR